MFQKIHVSSLEVSVHEGCAVSGILRAHVRNPYSRAKYDCSQVLHIQPQPLPETSPKLIHQQNFLVKPIGDIRCPIFKYLIFFMINKNNKMKTIPFNFF